MNTTTTHKMALGTKEEMAVQRLELELSMLQDIKNKSAWLEERINKKKRDLEYAKQKLAMTTKE